MERLNTFACCLSLGLAREEAGHHCHLEELAATTPLTIVWLDRGGNWHTEMTDVVDIERVRSAWDRLTMGPAARVGIVKKVCLWAETSPGNMACIFEANQPE